MKQITEVNNNRHETNRHEKADMKQTGMTNQKWKETEMQHEQT